MNAQQKDRELATRIAASLGDTHPQAAAHAWIDHARTLRRAQLTLHRWAEEMCNGTIQREGPDGDGKPFRVGGDGRRLWDTPDRERGALARVEKVCKETGLTWYYQRDPRGCALYVAAEPLNSQNYSTKGVPCL